MFKFIISYENDEIGKKDLHRLKMFALSGFAGTHDQKPYENIVDLYDSMVQDNITKYLLERFCDLKNHSTVNFVESCLSMIHKTKVYSETKE